MSVSELSQLRKSVNELKKRQKELKQQAYYDLMNDKDPDEKMQQLSKINETIRILNSSIREQNEVSTFAPHYKEKDSIKKDLIFNLNKRGE